MQISGGHFLSRCDSKNITKSDPYLSGVYHIGCRGQVKLDAIKPLKTGDPVPRQTLTSPKAAKVHRFHGYQPVALVQLYPLDLPDSLV